jgi:major membrane immunogen (membrane-anchored lipoprotein)
MKKWQFLVILALCAVAVLDAQVLRSGFYFAQAPRYAADGWRDQVVLEVEGGKIRSALWNEISIVAGMPDRKAWTNDSSDWAAQADKVERFLVSSQNLNAVSVSGVTIPTDAFFALARQALQKTPTEKGAYRNSGWFYSEIDAADGSGDKTTTLITVVNGTIVDVLWNGTTKADGIEVSKIILSASNRYPMNAPQGAWHVQTFRASEALVKAQDPAKITMKADTTPDAVTGVSISVKDYLEAARRALQGAR